MHLKINFKINFKKSFKTKLKETFFIFYFFFFKNKTNKKVAAVTKIYAHVCHSCDAEFLFKFPYHTKRLSLHFFVVSSCHLFTFVLPFCSNIIIVTADSREKGIKTIPKIFKVFPVYAFNHLCQS